MTKLKTFLIYGNLRAHVLWFHVIMSVIILSPQIASTQSFDHKISTLPSESNITHNVVYSINADDMGFLWFGKMDGLFKYNGYNFESFTTTFDSKTGLSNPMVTVIENFNDYLAVGTKNGLNFLDLKTETFTYLFPSDYNLNYNNIITSIVRYSRTRMLVGTQANLLDVSKNKDGTFNINQISFEGFEKHNRSIEIRQILAINDGSIVYTSEGLFFLERQTSNAKRINLKSNNNTEISNITALYLTQSKTLLIGTNYGAYYISLGSNWLKNNSEQNIKPLLQLYPDLPKIKRINTFLEDTYGNILMGTEGEGLFVYNKRTQNWHNYRRQVNFTNVLRNDFIRSLYQDKSGMVIIGTDAGINTLMPQEQMFQLINRVKENNIEEEILNVHSILEDNNKNLWIGTRGKGLFVISENSKEHINIKETRNGSLNHIKAIIQDKQKQIWIGTDKGIYILKKYDFEFKVLSQKIKTRKPDLLSNEYIYAILEDHESNKWISTASGLYVYSANGNLQKLNNLPALAPLGKSIIYTMMLDSQDRIWFGTLNGLILYIDSKDYKNRDLSLSQNLTSINFNPIGIVPSSQKFYENYETFSIVETSKNGILAGTNLGLCKINVKLNELSPFFDSQISPKSMILQSNYIFGLLNDEINNTLWISTNQGLFSYNFITQDVKQYTLKDGLQSLEFNGNSTFKNNDGVLYFGGGNGINVYDKTRKLQKSEFQPKLVLTKLFINGNLVSYKNSEDLIESNITYAKKIKLSASNNNIGFEFSSLHFPYSSNNSYKCKLIGIDNDWISLGHKRSINYTNLPKGTYSFLLMGTNNDDVWNSKELHFEIEVLPVWYKTWWMMMLWYLIILLTIIAFVWIVLRNRDNVNALKIKEIESKQIHDIYESKLMFFTNLSHEFRTPLSLILDPFQSLIQQKKIYNNNKYLFDIIKNNVDRLSRLMDQIMDFRKFEYGKLSLKITQSDIVSVVSTISNSFAHHAKIKNVNYKIELPKKPITMFFDPDSIEKVIYNLLSNGFKAVKSGGNVSISIKEPNKNFSGHNYKQISGENTSNTFTNHICIKVSDDGIGISDKNLEKIFTRFYQDDGIDSGTGIGLYMVKQFTELHYGSIFLKSKKNEGTIFKIILPKNDDIYQSNRSKKISIPKLFKDKKDENLSSIPKQTLEAIKTKPYTVVIVEDNDELRMYLKIILEKFYNVYTANDGLEGFELINDENPDIILSDIVMPEIDGVEMCKKIKENFETSHIPIILLTAKSFDNQIIEGINSGADDYITKPFNKEVLIAKINNLIKNREKLRLTFQNSKILEPSAITVTSIDEKLIHKLKELVEKNIQNPQLTLEMLATEVGVSRAQLFRKVKALTGLTPNNFIKSIRLKYAIQLLESEKFQITEVAFLSGFNEPSYFSTCFKKAFGYSPKEFKKDE